MKNQSRFNLVDNKILRKFGIAWVLFLSVFGVIFYSRYLSVSYVLFSVAGGSLILSLVFPKALFPVFMVWSAIGKVLGYVNRFIIMAVIFYFVFTPFGYIAKLFGKDFLRKKMNKKSETYWKKRDQKPVSMKYQF